MSCTAPPWGISIVTPCRPSLHLCVLRATKARIRDGCSTRGGARAACRLSAWRCSSACHGIPRTSSESTARVLSLVYCIWSSRLCGPMTLMSGKASCESPSSCKSPCNPRSGAAAPPPSAPTSLTVEGWKVWNSLDSPAFVHMPYLRRPAS